MRASDSGPHRRDILDAVLRLFAGASDGSEDASVTKRLDKCVFGKLVQE